MPEGEPRILYVADPMCSWCWGFAPVVTRLYREYRDRLSLEIHVGGLRPAESAEVVDEQMKAYLRHHWEAVHEKTGQPFDHAFFERQGFVYNTDPSCQAVVTVRERWPGEEWGYIHALQEAFYANNRDITSPDVLRAVAEETGLDGKAFLERYKQENTQQKTWSDYSTSRSLGVTGFPSLVLVREGQGFMLTQGYQPYEIIERQLGALL